MKTTDTDNKTALLPVPAESDSSSEHDEHASPPFDQSPVTVHSAPAFLSVLRGILISFFSAVTLSAFGICTFSALSAADFDVYFPVRLMLGELFGGYRNIETVPADNKIAEYRSPLLKESRDESRSGASDPVQDSIPKDPPEQSPNTRMTMASDMLGLVNETPYEPDTEALLGYGRVIPPADQLYTLYGDDAPLVLILHTHGTEAYSECADTDYRSTDTSENVVSCGAVIAETLESRGIHTIHSKTMFDEEDFTMAYYSASLEIRRITEEYPSVSYIIDVHRDSILSGDTHIAPSAEYGDEFISQMMFVIGTDHGGSGHTTWQNNLSLALRLQDDLNKETPQLMRTINLRSASFNEQYSDGSLLLEIGACGSSLEEAHRSAELFACALADEILGEQKTYRH